MIKDVWKKFDETELRHSSVHHLLAVDTLLTEQGYVRATDVANYLQLSRASVSITLKKLRDKGYIVEDQNKFLNLSEKGRELTTAVLSKRRLVETFFARVLGVSPVIAEEEACKVEHLLTDVTSARLLTFIGLYLSDNPQAVNFRKEFARYVHQCDEQSCTVCTNVCYFAGKEELLHG